MTACAQHSISNSAAEASSRNAGSVTNAMTTSAPVKHVLIVGGGTAGWITAAVLAAGHNSAQADGLRVTLLESPDVNTIGVGEGTWPTMRETLRQVGIKERDFLRECAVAFKQGSRFARWRDGTDDDFYYHPFSLPHGYQQANLVPFWQSQGTKESFARAFSTQEVLCEQGKAPKQAGTPDYAAVANYAYHLDAGKFADFLKRHATNELGVTHILDHMTGIEGTPDQPVRAG